MKPEAKLDLAKLHKADYAAPRLPVLLEIKPARYLAISGAGAPGGAEFGSRVGALYAMAYTIKMTRKFAGLQDYAVGRLEARYFFESGAPDLQMDDWRWELLIRTPDFIHASDLAAAVAKLRERGKTEPVDEVTLERIDEGRCVQMLHVGPYEKEGETIEKMRAFAASKGLRLVGPHHEIYLSDPRRVPPERLRTILRGACAP